MADISTLGRNGKMWPKIRHFGQIIRPNVAETSQISLMADIWSNTSGLELLAERHVVDSSSSDVMHNYVPGEEEAQND